MLFRIKFIFMIVATFIALPSTIGQAASMNDWRDCLGRNPQKALAGCTNVIRSGGGGGYPIGRAYFKRGVAHGKMKKTTKAISDLTNAIEIDPEQSVIYAVRAMAYRKSGRFDLALTDLSKAIQIDGNNHKFYNDRGNVYKNLGKNAKAVSDYSRAIQLHPRYIFSYMGRAAVLKRMGQRKRALSDCRKAASFKARNPKEVSTQVRAERCIEDLSSW